MMSVSVIIEANASGIITQPAAATMPRRVVSLLISVVASLPEVWASTGAMAASRQPVVRRNRFMCLVEALRPLTSKRDYRFNQSRQAVGVGLEDSACNNSCLRAIQ